MTINMGTIDRALRAIIGLALLYFAFFAAPTGYNWIGYIGFVPLLTAAIGSCPLYSILGISTCPMKRS
ncbi:MAG: YgaP family membrane protein [Beijerinckiaceae bacterium]